MSSNEDFAKGAYTQYCNLFAHYSSLIFKSRISIISLALIMFIIVLGVSLGIKSNTVSSVPLSAEFSPIVTCLLPFLSAVIILLLFSIQNAYVKRSLEVVQAAREIESKYQTSLFFSNFERIPQVTLFMIYFFFCFSFLVIFLILIFIQKRIWLVIAGPLALLVVFWFLLIAKEIRQRTKEVLGEII